MSALLVIAVRVATVVPAPRQEVVANVTTYITTGPVRSVLLIMKDVN